MTMEVKKVKFKNTKLYKRWRLYNLQALLASKLSCNDRATTVGDVGTAFTLSWRLAVN